MIRWMPLAAIALAITACSTAPGPAPFRAKFNSDVFMQKVDAINTPAQVRSFISNTTSRSISRGHGNQIEFIAGNGRTFLWYPENARIVQGRWKTEMRDVRVMPSNTTERRANLCFQYGADTFNPVTQIRGGAWECRSIAIWMANSHEIRKGDVMGLSQGLPYTLSKFPEMTLTELRLRSGNTTPMGRNLAIWRENVQ